MFCRICGKKIPEDSRFCPQCGEAVWLPDGEFDGVQTDATIRSKVAERIIAYDVVKSELILKLPREIIEGATLRFKKVKVLGKKKDKTPRDVKIKVVIK